MIPGSFFENLYQITDPLLWGLGKPLQFAYANSFFSVSWDAKNGWKSSAVFLFKATHVQLDTEAWYKIDYRQ